MRRERHTLDPQEAELEALVEHIEDTYHAGLRFDLGVLEAHLSTCRDADPSDPGLEAIEGLLTAFRDDVLAHLRAEERGIFRIIRGHGPESATRTIGDVDSHHDHLAMQVAALAEAVATHAPKAAYAAVWDRFVAKLRMVVEDFTEHSRLETDVLFPRALAAELVIGGGTPWKGDLHD